MLLAACGAGRTVTAAPEREPSTAEHDAILAALAWPDVELLGARIVGDRALAVVFHHGEVTLPTARARVCEGPPRPAAERELLEDDDCGGVALVRVVLGGAPRVEDHLTLEAGACEPHGGVELCSFRVVDLDGDGSAEVHLVYSHPHGYMPRVLRVIDASTFAVELSDETEGGGRSEGVVRRWTFAADSGRGTAAHLETLGTSTPASAIVDPGGVPSEAEAFDFEDGVDLDDDYAHDPSRDCWRDEAGGIAATEHEPEAAPRRTSRLEFRLDLLPACTEPVL